MKQVPREKNHLSKPPWLAQDETYLDRVFDRDSCAAPSPVHLPFICREEQKVQRCEKEKDSVFLPCCSEPSSASPCSPVRLTPVDFSFLFCKTRLLRPPSLKWLSAPYTIHGLVATPIVALTPCPPLLPPTPYLRMRDRLPCPVHIVMATVFSSHLPFLPFTHCSS